MTKGKKTTPQACIDSLREATKELGHSPSRAEYERLGISPSPSAIRYHFGNWNAAKEEADLETVGVGGSLSVNEDYFESVDAETAYWLGLLWADGSISGKNNVSLGLMEREHIGRFRDAIEAEHAISDDGEFHTISIKNDRFADNLRDRGFTNTKTHDASLPDVEADELQAAFVRGLFDGDGHAGGRGRFNITGASRKRFEKLGDWLRVPTKIVDRGDGAYTFRVGSGMVYHLFCDLYPEDKNTEPKLDRKYTTWKKKMLSI
jgi:hypothetical protein